MTPFTPLRRLLVLSLALLCLAAAAPAATATDGADGTDGAGVTGVTGSDLPSADRVGGIFDHVRDGGRTTFGSRDPRLEIRGRTCVGYGPGYVAGSSRFASYTTADGRKPYFAGLADPTFVVYEFASPRRARAGLARLTEYAIRCEGLHRSGPRYSLRTTPIRLDGVPGRYVAYRETRRDAGNRTWDAEVFVLAGDRIERSWIQHDRRAPEAADLARMSRLLADVAR